MKRLLISFAAVALSLVPSNATAAVFQLNYTTLADSLFDAVTVDATLTTDNGEFYGLPGYLVTGITGTRGGVAIDGLADPFSEIFFPGAPDFVDGFGITFTAGGRDFNVFKSNAAFYQEFSYVSGDFNNDGEGRLILNGAISLNPAIVPEPAAWALLIGGFATVGVAMRRRRPAAA